MVLNPIESIFSLNRRHIDLFKEIAHTITNEHVEEAISRMSDDETSFDEMMVNVSRLHDELTRRAIWCMDTYKEEKGRGSANLPRASKKIIKQCTTDYIYKVKMLITVQKSRYKLTGDYIYNKHAS